jgi:hypothetical protein
MLEAPVVGQGTHLFYLVLGWLLSFTYLVLGSTFTQTYLIPFSCHPLIFTNSVLSFPISLFSTTGSAPPKIVN